MNPILERINQLQRERDWSYYQLAKAADIPSTTISSWFQCDRLPNYYAIEKIAAAYGITVSEFFALHGEPVELTEEQRELIDNWSKLSLNQRTALLEFLRTL